MGVEEKRVEDYLKVEVKKLDGFCLKLGGYKGIPDRLVLLPGCPAVFIELKKDNGTVSSAQLIRVASYRKIGHEAEIVYTRDDVDSVLHRIYNLRGGAQ